MGLLALSAISPIRERFLNIREKSEEAGERGEKEREEGEEERGGERKEGIDDLLVG